MMSLCFQGVSPGSCCPFTLVRFANNKALIVPPEAGQCQDEILPLSTSERFTLRWKRGISALKLHPKASVNGAHDFKVSTVLDWQEDTLKSHRRHHHDIYCHDFLGATALVFCVNYTAVHLKVEMLRSVWITNSRELANRRCGDNDLLTSCMAYLSCSLSVTPNVTSVRPKWKVWVF